MINGLLRFGRYAFPPNRLGYCGPNDHQALLDYVAAGAVDQGMRDLARRFEGAVPYLTLIAHANSIQDPFDPRVVEAYWLGNDLLARVDAASFHASLGARFGARMTTNAFGWLATKLEAGARPHHNFHVFEVYQRAGLMQDARATIAIATMDACRISWGTVQTIDGAELVVLRRPLVLQQGKLSLGEGQIVRVLRQLNGKGFAQDVRVGDVVSLHWEWACEVISSARLARLQAVTMQSLAHANTTM